VTALCVVLCNLSAERRHCFLCAAGSDNRNNRLRSKQDLHEITVWYNLWQNTAAFWVLKEKWAGFWPSLFDPGCGNRCVVCVIPQLRTAGQLFIMTPVTL
jgi:hypothetical protein